MLHGQRGPSCRILNHRFEIAHLLQALSESGGTVYLTTSNDETSHVARLLGVDISNGEMLLKYPRTGNATEALPVGVTLGFDGEHLGEVLTSEIQLQLVNEQDHVRYYLATIPTWLACAEVEENENAPTFSRMLSYRYAG
jgi:hypothetical protein